MVWLTHLLSQADHRMNRVQEWATRRLETLHGCGVNTLEPGDLTDDRLADVLRALSGDVHWQAFEQELMGQLVRVYDLQAQGVRIGVIVVAELGTGVDRFPTEAHLKLNINNAYLRLKCSCFIVTADGGMLDSLLFLSKALIMIMKEALARQLMSANKA